MSSSLTRSSPAGRTVSCASAPKQQHSRGSGPAAAAANSKSAAAALRSRGRHLVLARAEKNPGGKENPLERIVEGTQEAAENVGKKVRVRPTALQQYGAAAACC